MTTVPHRSRLSLVTLLLSLAAGCGGDSLSKDEIDRSRTAVDTFLASWKQGDQPDKLKGQAIVVEDPDWSAGSKLLEYQITGTDVQNTANPRFTVKLTVKGDDGSSNDKIVVYEANAKKESGKVLIGRDPFH